MDIEQASPVIAPLLAEIVEKQFEVFMASACTEDGFVIAHRDSQILTLEDDKVAALSSTLLSMSEAAARIVGSGPLKVTILEAQNANLVVVKTRYRSLPVILTIAAGARLPIGQTLYLANRLAERIGSV